MKMLAYVSKFLHKNTAWQDSDNTMLINKHKKLHNDITCDMVLL